MSIAYRKVVMRIILSVLAAFIVAGCATSRVSYVVVDSESVLEEINQLGSTRIATLTLRDPERKFRVSFVHVDFSTTTYRWKEFEGAVPTANVSSIRFTLNAGKEVLGTFVGAGVGFVAGYYIGRVISDGGDEGTGSRENTGKCNFVCIDLDFSDSVPGLAAIVGAGVGAGLGFAVGSSIGGRNESVVFHRFEPRIGTDPVAGATE